jgi:hypothetical protein
MSLYYVRHQHSAATCPAKNPEMGAMLLQHLSQINANRYGVVIHGEAVLDNQHTLVLIVEAQTPDQVGKYMQPFQQAGSVEVVPASTCEEVVQREGCEVVEG